MVNTKIVQCCLNCEYGVFYPDSKGTDFQCSKGVASAWMDMWCFLWAPSDGYKEEAKLVGKKEGC